MDFKVYYDNQRKLIENFLETRMAKKVSVKLTMQWLIACLQAANVFVLYF